MNTKIDPKEIAVSLLPRSKCAVQVAAVLVDKHGVFAWGWNSSGPTGLGQHAEAHAISRANGRRLAGATIFVAARRRKSGRPVTALPCEACAKLLDDVYVKWRDNTGTWRA